MSSTCIIKRPDPQALFDRIKNQFSADVLGGAPVVPDSNEWYVVSNQYLATELWYSLADQMWKEEDPRHACCDNLVKIAARNGIYPRPATFSRGYVKITGTSGAVLSSAMSIQFDDKVYRVDSTSTVPDRMPTSGYVIVRMTASEPGPDGNAAGSSSTTGKLISNLAGIDRDVTVYGASFCGGKAVETCEEFRTRYLARAAAGHRAKIANLIEDMKEFPCVTRVSERSCDCCPDLGGLNYFVFMDDTFEHGLPTQQIVDEMTGWFFGDPPGAGKGVAPLGIRGQFYAATAISVNVTLLNLPCTTTQQVEEVRNRIRAMFTNLRPGQEVCKRMIDAVVIQVLGFDCAFEVIISVDGASLCGDGFVPECDQLPVAGSINISGISTR